MEKGSILTLMAPLMKVNGWITNIMAREKNHGQMVQSTREITSMVSATALACSSGVMEVNSRAVLSIAKWKAKVFTVGKMVESTKALGRTT